MSKVLYLLCAILLMQNVKAQSTTELFYLLPDRYVDNLTAQQRKNLVEKKTLEDENEDILYSLEYDEENAYLSFEMSFTQGQSGYFHFEMTYWNLKNKKLVAISSISGSNGGYHQANFKFFEYKNGNLAEVNSGYLKGYTSDFDVFMKNLVLQFTKKETNELIKEDLKEKQFTISLPRQGKDIIIGFGEGALQDYFETHYAKHLNFREKIYKWNVKKEIFE